MTDDRLAKRYRDLLDFYPRAYRDERGEELVGTLLECSRPGQRRPTWRESRSLILEGLRMRAGTSARRPARAVLLDALHLVVLLLIASWVLGAATGLLHVDFGPTGDPRPVAGVVLLAGVVPFALVALGRFALALPFLAAGAMAWVPWFRFWGPDDYFVSRMVVASVFAVVAAVALWWWQPMASRAGAGIVVCAVVPPLLHDLPTWLVEFGANNPDDIFWYYQAFLFVLMYLGVLAYIPVDPRPAIAMAAFIAVDFADSAASSVGPGHVINPVLAVAVVAVPAVTFLVALAGVRRQARDGSVGTAG